MKIAVFLHHSLFGTFLQSSTLLLSPPTANQTPIRRGFTLHPNFLQNLFKLSVLLLALSMAQPLLAVEKQRINKRADRPRFNYSIDRPLESIVRDKATFDQVTVKIRSDIEFVLAHYDIPHKPSQQQYLETLTQLDFLAGNYDAALVRVEDLRALEETPVDRLLFGLQWRAMVAAAKQTGDINTPAYLEAVSENIRKELDHLPYESIANSIKHHKEIAEAMEEDEVLFFLNEVPQASVNKAGVLIAALAPSLIRARYQLETELPLKQTLINTYTAYLDQHQTEKTDIWAARKITLSATGNYTPVNVVVWDSGVDTKLFPNQLLLDNTGNPTLIAFDLHAQATTGELYPIPSDVQPKLSEMLTRIKGFFDMSYNADSSEAIELKQFMSKLTPKSFTSTFEQLRLVGNYVHGTHVAGIMLEGNPWARLLTARLTFEHKQQPDPCPSKALFERTAKASQAFVDYFKQYKVRVVNISWGGRVKEHEDALKKCKIGKTPAERKKLARDYLEIEKQGLQKAFSSAPDILFIAIAGNSDLDARFGEFVPSSIQLPNLLTVGAVDQDGNEAPFTSYRSNATVHTSGYQVTSYLPGGQRVALSGTATASPNVANLAAKLLAIQPSLTPTELIAMIRKTADKTEDGQRLVINPVKAMAQVM
jgi:hypothetical protein